MAAENQYMREENLLKNYICRLHLEHLDLARIFLDLQVTEKNSD
jgi:hypothetical protein